jgi:hypothetical protein
VHEVLRHLAGLIAEQFPRSAHEEIELEDVSIKPRDLVRSD